MALQICHNGFMCSSESISAGEEDRDDDDRDDMVEDRLLVDEDVRSGNAIDAGEDGDNVAVMGEEAADDDEDETVE